MGAFDGAEVCEAVGNFLLYQLSKNYNKKDIGLYRDDGLAIFKNVSGSKAEKIKKVIFLMLRTDFFASPTMKSHKYIKNQTTHHPFKANTSIYRISSFKTFIKRKNIYRIYTNLSRSSKKNTDITTN